jgi:hypothetical protein
MKLLQNKTNSQKLKWSAYFLEFIMLFLAVTLGFMADSFRDKLSENEKEIEYIQSMIEDLEEDKVNIKKVLEINKKRVESLALLSNLCFSYNGSNQDKVELNFNFIQVLIHPEFLTAADLTMQQLKNAGGMQFIKSKKAIKDILRYDTKLKEIANQQLYYENYQNKAIDIGTKIFDVNKLFYIVRQPDVNFREVQFELLVEDAYLMKTFGNIVTMYKGIIEYYLALLDELDEQGAEMQQTLKEVYNLR